MAQKWPELDQNLNIFSSPPPPSPPPPPDSALRTPAILDVHTQGPAYKKWPRAPKFENRHWVVGRGGGVVNTSLVHRRKNLGVGVGVRRINFN